MFETENESPGKPSPAVVADARDPRPLFPPTRWSRVLTAGDPEDPDFRESLGYLARTYWHPIQIYLRRRWNRSEHEASDITQDFFIAMCEKALLKGVRPERGRFRYYVRACLDNFVRMRIRAAARRKRGGDRSHISIDVDEGLAQQQDSAPPEILRKEWARSILQTAAAELECTYRAAGKQKAFEIFMLRDLDPSSDPDRSYKALATRLGMSLSDVSVTLYRTRRAFRDLVWKRVRDTVESDEDAHMEIEDLFGN